MFMCAEGSCTTQNNAVESVERFCLSRILQDLQRDFVESHQSRVKQYLYLLPLACNLTKQNQDLECLYHKLCYTQ